MEWMTDVRREKKCLGNSDSVQLHIIQDKIIRVSMADNFFFSTEKRIRPFLGKKLFVLSPPLWDLEDVGGQWDAGTVLNVAKKCKVNEHVPKIQWLIR